VIHHQQENKDGEASARHAMALVYEDMGRPDRAVTFYEWALKLRQQAGDRAGEAITAYNLAKVYEKLGHLNEAESMLSQAVQIEELTHHPDEAKDRMELIKLREKMRKVAAGETQQNRRVSE
jgi:tetratricopeptide (TPR) repeat protein